MLTETEFEKTLAVVAGRSHLDARLTRLSPGELQAFWEAVRRCYASSPEPES